MAGRIPLEGVLGADPGWLLAEGVAGDSLGIRWQGERWLSIRRPVRFDASSEGAMLAPCLRVGGRLDACGGRLDRRESASLAGTGWSFTDRRNVETDWFASLGLGESDRRVRFWHEQGTHRLASGVGLRWRRGGWGLAAGVERSRDDGSLRVRAEEGVLDLDWPSRTDSMGLALEMPLGEWDLRGGWWRARRDGMESDKDHLTDTTLASGWRIEGVRHWPAGSLGIHLWREDRQGTMEGHRFDEVFLEQVLESSRAALGASLRWKPWGLFVETRQWSLRSPQGGLDHPSLHWNLLSKGVMAPFTSLVEDRRDFLFGTFSVQIWDAEFQRAYRRGAWTLVPRWRFRWIGMEADIQRVRLAVKTLLPMARRDTLAMGTGWIVATGPRLEVRRRVGLGMFVGWLGIRVPVAGDWDSPGAEESNSSSSEASPVDPLGGWEAGGALEF